MFSGTCNFLGASVIVILIPTCLFVTLSRYIYLSIFFSCTYTLYFPRIKSIVDGLLVSLQVGSSQHHLAHRPRNIIRFLPILTAYKRFIDLVREPSECWARRWSTRLMRTIGVGNTRLTVSWPQRTSTRHYHRHSGQNQGALSSSACPGT